MKKIIAIALLLILTVSVFTGCSGNSSITGEWYDSKGHCLDIRKDGTFKLDGEYGTGKWKKLDNTNYEFYDFYGQPYEAELLSDESGVYFDIEYYGNFYKGSYPNKSDNNNSNDINIEETTTTAVQTIILEPFEDLTFETSGISPYCQVTVNNTDCNYDVQMNVSYSFDKEYYANGDKVTVTATLNSSSDDYTLSQTEYTFDLPERPEYITSVDDIDFSLLTSERDDMVNSNFASAIGEYSLFGVTVNTFEDTNSYCNYTSINSSKIKEEYLMSLKPIKQNLFSDEDYVFNALCFTYEISITWSHEGDKSWTGDGKIYTTIYAYNIVKYPDGTIKWGNYDPDSYDFSYRSTVNGVEDCVTQTVMRYSDNYNIEKVDIEKKTDN